MECRAPFRLYRWKSYLSSPLLKGFEKQQVPNQGKPHILRLLSPFLALSFDDFLYVLEPKQGGRFDNRHCCQCLWRCGKGSSPHWVLHSCFPPSRSYMHTCKVFVNCYALYRVSFFTRQLRESKMRQNFAIIMRNSGHLKKYFPYFVFITFSALALGPWRRGSWWERLTERLVFFWGYHMIPFGLEFLKQYFFHLVKSQIFDTILTNFSL